MPHTAHTRRQFIGYFSSIGLSSTLLPGVLWSQVQEQQATKVTPEMLQHALAVAGLEFSDDEREAILNGVNQNLTRYAELRQIHIDSNLAPPLYYSPLVPGTKLTTGELAAGDQWFGGRTNNPWDPKDGSSGSSAGPASATAAGCVAFGIGTETSGSILSPSTVCGV